MVAGKRRVGRETTGLRATADDESTHSYVPIDPCQPVIAALRAAMSEHIPRAFIDLETSQFRAEHRRCCRMRMH